VHVVPQAEIVRVMIESAKKEFRRRRKATAIPETASVSTKISEGTKKWGHGACRAIVWLIDHCGDRFQEAEGAPGFGAVVVEAGVEAFEFFQIVET